MKKTINILIILYYSVNAFAQIDSAEVEKGNFGLEDTTVELRNKLVKHTFHSTRIINAHSIETLRKGVLEFRVEHRFGDIAGDQGGIQTMFGIDNATDIRIAFEYGVTNDLMLGIGRSKGTGNPYRSLLDGFVKYRILKQKEKGMPVSLTATGVSTFTYMRASNDITQISHFPQVVHRMAYAFQLNAARKFGERLSLALMPTYVHRNYVAADDINGLFSMGGAVRLGITGTLAVLVEYHQNLHANDVRNNNTNSLGLAFEWITFGHNFTINLTNSKGFVEPQFIPYTFEDWTKGQFRIGFTIGRKFEFGK